MAESSPARKRKRKAERVIYNTHIWYSRAPQPEYAMCMCSCESFTSVDAGIERFQEMKKDKTLCLLCLETCTLGFETYKPDGCMTSRGPGTITLGEVRKLEK